MKSVHYTTTECIETCTNADCYICQLCTLPSTVCSITLSHTLSTQTQMQAGGSSARGGEMYDTVSHEPRHKVPSSKSKRQHSSSGEEASLL